MEIKNGKRYFALVKLLSIVLGILANAIRSLTLLKSKKRGKKSRAI